MEDQERIVFMVPGEVKTRFKKAVKTKGMSIAFVLRNLIENWEKANRPGPGRKSKKVAGF